MSQERAARGGRQRRLGRSTTPENRTTAAQGSSAGHEVQPPRKFAAAPLGGAFAEPWSARKLVGLLAVFGPAAIAPRDAVDNPLLTMATAFAYVGGTVMSYVVYANWVGMRRWGMTAHPEIDALRRHAFGHDAIDYLPDDPAEVARVRKSVAPLRWDVGMGAVVLFIVTAAFMVSGAAVLYPLQSTFEGWGLLTEQRHVWSNIHGSLIWIYYIAIIAALWGTLQALPEVYARVMQEFGQAIRPHRNWSYDRIERIVCGYLLVTTFIVVWLDIPFDILTQVAGFILANLAISLMMAAALYLNFKLPAAYRTRLPMLAGAVASALVLFAFAGISGWGLAGKLFGSG